MDPAAATEADRGDLMRGLRPPAWLHLGLGALGRGAAGLADAHRSALLATSVARASGVQIASYDASRPTALGTLHLPARALFVRTVLRGALGSDARSRDCRSAALAFLTTGGSRQQAAQQLSVAPNTIASRVAQLAEMLGRPMEERRLETMVALHLADRLPVLLQPAGPQ